MAFGMLLVALALFRILNGLVLCTYFDPDEYWQALEIAHYQVFGYGYVSWEWQYQLRSFAHPLVFSILYKVLDILSLDLPWLIAHGPLLLQSLLAAIGDYHLYRLADQWFGNQTAKWSLFCQLSNWFVFYCLPRTYSNSLETVLTLIALSYWPWKSLRENRVTSLALAALCFLIRPTSAILWSLLGIWTLYQSNGKERLNLLLFQVLPIGLCCLVISVGIDYLFYGEVTLVFWNFVKFNVILGVSAEYGVHPWHWYFTNGLPTVMGSYLPLFLGGVYASHQYQYASLAIATIAILSFLAHKELRFMLSVLPIFLIYCGHALHVLHQSYFNTKQLLKLFGYPVRISTITRRIIVLLVCIQVVMALYFSVIHQRGTISIMDHIQEIAQKDPNVTLQFLTPCHATPYYSHIHQNISMAFLECPPSVTGLLDEQLIFFENPMRFLNLRYEKAPLPRLLVLFDNMETLIRPFLSENNYTQIASLFHCHFRVRESIGNYIKLFSREPNLLNQLNKN